MRSFAISLLAVLSAAHLSACASAPKPNVEQAVTQPATLAEIAGLYRVLRFGNHTPRWVDRGGRGAFFNFTDRDVGYHLGCNYSGAAIALSPDGIIRPRTFPDDVDYVVTTAGCASRAASRRDTQLFAFFKDPVALTRLADGRLRLDGEELSVLLEPEEKARLRNAPGRLSDISGRWYPTFVKSEGRGYGAPYLLKTVTLRGEGAEYGGCPVQPGQLSIDQGRLLSDGTITHHGGVPLAVTACPPINPAEDILMQVLSGDPAVEWISNDQLELRSDGRALVLSDRPVN